MDGCPRLKESDETREQGARGKKLARASAGEEKQKTSIMSRHTGKQEALALLAQRIHTNRFVGQAKKKTKRISDGGGGGLVGPHLDAPGFLPVTAGDERRRARRLKSQGGRQMDEAKHVPARGRWPDGHHANANGVTRLQGDATRRLDMELELIARYSTSFGLLTTNQAHVVDGVGSRRAGSFIAPPRDLRPRVHLSITSTRTLAGARRIEPCSKNEQWEAKPPACRLVNANKPFMESNRAPRAKGLARRGNTRTFRASPSLALPSAPPPPASSDGRTGGIGPGTGAQTTNFCGVWVP
ncbi:hypothetical protein Purlil1_6500 [Purpureocillium lilacinum]|uniref:Uncharacterized protein n=1 Tax=Purpureocillium lilacinum TaxID=33203 RepID=A0ABR0BYV0_PURLI|nr:hypothetical protein Purlil1_6500 [Purpureocillium lilacinum]